MKRQKIKIDVIYFTFIPNLLHIYLVVNVFISIWSTKLSNSFIKFKDIAAACKSLVIKFYSGAKLTVLEFVTKMV